ncbi:uncharacterized protein B0T23DRAFT_354390 [Neurospora hispaniola]|uniref:Uncharacterized protein n=1 Tax=Neurospora hispaniola TaxID=588809 RepID=A0AAJ0IDU6_9PEZI|nr:hypothetical protein B0T23DRAFT_354390 [Neurospora hispaniola]
MTSPAVLNSDREVPAVSGLLDATEEPPVVLANSDRYVSTHEDTGMATDGACIDRLETNVAGFYISNGSATESTAVEIRLPCTEKSSAKTQFSTSGTNFNSFQAPGPNGISNSALSEPGKITPNQAMQTSTSITRRHMNHTEDKKLDLKPTSRAVISTEPVGIYYPPRRLNIFRARAKNLRFTERDRNPVASHAVDKFEVIMEDDSDDFSLEDLEEFKVEAKQKMEKKTARFMSAVQQCAWRSRVEDLGTVQEIEEYITTGQIWSGCSWLFRIPKAVRVRTVAKSSSVVWCSSNVATKSSDVASNSSPVASRPEEDINVEPLQLPLSKFSSSPISQRGSQFAPAPAPTLLHTCTKPSHRTSIFQPTYTPPLRPTPRRPHCRHFWISIFAQQHNDFDMFRALQHHRALARANEQQEATIEKPIHHPYQQTEALPFRRITLRDCFPLVNNPANDQKHDTSDNLITSNTLDRNIVETSSKNSSPIVENSNLGQDGLVDPLTSSLSKLKITPTPTRPGDNSQANWLTASPFSIHNDTDKPSNKPASKPRLSRREQRKLESRKWSNNALIDGRGRLDTKMNKLGKMRKRLHHRCTWVKKPFSLREFAHRAEQPVPFLVLTDPEGCKHFLEDPKKVAACPTADVGAAHQEGSKAGAPLPAHNVESVTTDDYRNPYHSVNANMGTDEAQTTENADSHDNIYTHMKKTSSRHILACASNISITDEKDDDTLAGSRDCPGADYYRHESASIATTTISTNLRMSQSTDVRPNTLDTGYFSNTEQPQTGLEYARLDDGLWYRLEEDGSLSEMTDQEYSDFISWRVNTLMSTDDSVPDPGVDAYTVDTAYFLDDRDWFSDALSDEDLEVFTTEDIEYIYSLREPNISEATDTCLRNVQNEERQSRRTRKKDNSWASHSLVDENGFIDTRKRRRQEEGRRLRGQCNWLRVPALPTLTNSSVPDLTLTSPEGESYSLHDPLDYE